MPASTIPLSVPVSVVRLTPDEIDALWLWVSAVMRSAGVPDRSRRSAIGILNDVEAAILHVRQEACPPT
ncbi:MAG: hypothetical protein H6649_11300 [Caldilineae bacterium]|nr:hypothetical protein [Caldilineae bacterium]